MKALLKLARVSSLHPIVHRGKVNISDNTPEDKFIFMGPVDTTMFSKHTKLKGPSTTRGVKVETVGLGVRKAIQPSVATDKMYQVKKYGG